MSPASGFVWSMNCDSCEEPKNSLIAATTGRMLISVCGVIASTSWVVMRSRTTRSMRREADAQLVLDELADGAHPAVAEVVDVVGEVAGVAVVQLHEVGDRREDVGLRQREVAAATRRRWRRGSRGRSGSRPRCGYSFESFFDTLWRPTFARS